MKDTQNVQQSYRKLKYYHNPQLNPDRSKADGGKITEGWILSETNWNESDFTNLVKTTSFYLPSKLMDGMKLKKNVEEIYFLTLDFDKGDPSMEKYIELSSKSKFCWFLHTRSGIFTEEY